MRRDLKVCPGHLAKRLGHRDSRTNMSKERDHEVTEGYQKQGAATPLGLEGWEGTPSGGRWDQRVCLAGGSWRCRGGAAPGLSCRWRQRDRKPGIFVASCPPRVPSLPRGWRARRPDEEPGGDQKREPRITAREAGMEEACSKHWLLLPGLG